MVGLLLRQASPDENLLHNRGKLVDSKWLIFEPQLIGLLERFSGLLKESLLPWVGLVELLAKARKRIAVLTCGEQACLSFLARFVDSKASLVIL